MIDALAGEPHFLEHIAPVWRALPDRIRGTLYVVGTLQPLARSLGIQAAGLESAAPGPGPLLVASYGDLKRGRKRGRTRFVLMQHGAGQSYGGSPTTARMGSYPGGDDNDDVGLFLVPNHHAATRWRERYPAAQVEVVGSPILDELPRRNLVDYPTAPVVGLAFHWDFRQIPEARSAFAWTMGMFRPLAREFTVIGHGHPRRKDLAGRYRQGRIEHVPSRRELFERADLLVFDNSSIGFEFAATGRPVVVLDPPYYRRNVSHGLRFWDAADVGIRADAPRELPDAIRRALADPPEARTRREAALELVYPLRTGAAQRAVDAIVSWLASTGHRLEAA